MRDVAIVSFAQSVCEAENRRDNMAEMLLPVAQAAMAEAGITRDDIDFYSSGSHDFFEGRAFAYIQTIDALGAWPPISESHVEMDAAWSVYEAFSYLQLGQGDIALVFGVGRGSLPHDHDQVVPSQLDPYFLTPLSPHKDALAGLQARALVDGGRSSERAMAETVARSLAAARDNPWAQKAGEFSVDSLLSGPYVAAPLREHDVSPIGDAAAAMVLATGDTARRLVERPAWIRGLDHRIDTQYPGMRDLTDAPSARLALNAARRQAGGNGFGVDVAELHTEYSHQERILLDVLELDDQVAVNPSGGPLAGRPVTATGLIRIGEASRQIIDGRAQRALGHATGGQCLQQNLVCLLEGSS